MTKRIVLCADDYGQAEAVSRGILDLIAAGRLSATSCLVNLPRWQEQAAELLPYLDKADVGLHLNFTEGKPLSFVYREQIGAEFLPLSQLLKRTVLRSSLLKPAALQAEIEAQLDQFAAAMGCYPRFIDGHQHVHHLPLIREALFAVYQRKLAGRQVYMRAVTQKLGLLDVFRKERKCLAIHLTGGARFAGLLDRQGIAHNTSFSGIYSFSEAPRYREYFQGFLRESDDRGMIMCHPGRPASANDDPIAYSRGFEFDYLRGQEFLEDCAEAKVVVTRFVAG